MPIKLVEGRRLLLFITATMLSLLILSGIHPYDRTTWVLEIFPVLIVLPLLWLTCRRFPLTKLLYILILVHSLVLMLGGAYTYARVPLGAYLADVLHLSRNPYDKIGHFFQGFVPALAAREILLRGQFVRGGKILFFVIICVVMAISAMYELVEWVSALILGQGAEEFLGTQGDPWDTQSDMFCALIGGCAALVVFSRVHDRQLQSMQGSPGVADVN